jgi:hypothetical protein
VDAAFGQAFIREFARSVEPLCFQPRAGAIGPGTAAPFSYRIVCALRDAELLIIAVAQQGRRPSSWLTRS